MLETRFICKKGIGNISFFYIDGVLKETESALYKNHID